MAGTAGGLRLTTISKAIFTGCLWATTLSQMTSTVFKHYRVAQSFLKQFDFPMGFKKEKMLQMLKFYNNLLFLVNSNLMPLRIFLENPEKHCNTQEIKIILKERICRLYYKI